MPAIASLVALAAAAGAPSGIEGYWVTADGAALVQIAPCGPRLCGTIRRVLRRGPNVPVSDVHNPQASLRTRPLVGLQVLTAFTRSGSQWVDGRAYDPKSGRSYKARLTSNPDGTLTVTGCLLFICQSQSWRRAP